MIDERELKLWIARLECEESSWSNYDKLATLYIIQNQQAQPGVNLQERPMLLQQSESTPALASVGSYGDSDFLRAVAGSNPEKAWNIMDELMDSLKIVNERVYNNIMRKFEAL